MTPRYHHGNLRAALIASAVDLARAEGPDGVVLRQVARMAGVSHNAAYRHFSDREALLAEVAAVGMRALEEAMEAALAEVTEQDPGRRARARLRAVGQAYVAFALDQPGLFRVAFATQLPDPVDPAAGPDTAEPASPGPYGLLNQALDELVDAGQLAPATRPDADLACWAAVHGFAVLHLDGPLQATPAAERQAGLDRMLTLIDAGITP